MLRARSRTNTACILDSGIYMNITISRYFFAIFVIPIFLCPNAERTQNAAAAEAAATAEYTLHLFCDLPMISMVYDVMLGHNVS